MSMTARRAAARQTVAERLRDDIVKGIFPPGERLIEVELSKRYEVGRAAIRYALVELDTQGLVLRETNRGATVRRISVAEAVEITEARMALECLVARRAAERATSADRGELRDLVKEMRAALKADDKAAYSRLNRQLHATLPRIARHTVADELIANLRARAVHQQYQLSGLPGRAEESLNQHVAIVAAVSEGEADLAELSMRQHLESVIEALRGWEHLDQPDG